MSTDSLKELRNVFHGLQTLYQAYFPKVDPVLNQRLSLEALKEICDSEYVLEVTGDYTGTLTGRGASHEPREHKH